MTTAQIVELQRAVGTDPDGFWGRLSNAACQKHLRALMPKPNPWPVTDESALREFYGAPGDESRLTNLAAPVPMFYEGTQIRTIRCHAKCAASLQRALTAAYGVAPNFVKIYDGCYNNRPMRGGSRPSLHSRGAAIDLSAETNGNTQHWPTSANMPLAVMEAFAVEGWLAAGAFWSRDAMHFQATQ